MFEYPAERVVECKTYIKDVRKEVIVDAVGGFCVLFDWFGNVWST